MQQEGRENQTVLKTSLRPQKAQEFQYLFEQKGGETKAIRRANLLWKGYLRKNKVPPEWNLEGLKKYKPARVVTPF